MMCRRALRSYKKYIVIIVLAVCACCLIVNNQVMLKKNQIIYVIPSPNKNQMNTESTFLTATVNRTLVALLPLLDELDNAIRKAVPENKIYGNIYSGKSLHQLKSYISLLITYERNFPVRRICEIGFAGGHSATLFLHVAKSASYTAFDLWDQPLYEDIALSWLKKRFPERRISVIKGDSTVRVPNFNQTCDVIHIDGAHHAHFPKTDMQNMARVASVNNLLLLDDCTESWPAVLEGIEYLKRNNLVYGLVQHVASGWSHRGAQKGWCIGHFNKKRPQNAIIFLNTKICLPMWHGKDCDRYDPEPDYKFNDKCLYNNITGVFSISCDHWESADVVIRNNLEKKKNTINSTESDAKSFNFFEVLPNYLGDVLDLGAGRTSELGVILKSHRASSITFVDPMALYYTSNLEHNLFDNSASQSIPTTIISMPVEDFPATRRFDTVVMMNVMEHAYDALIILSRVLKLIKDNGIFIWQERLWDGYTSFEQSECDRRIRIKSTVARLVISMFKPLMISWKYNDMQKENITGVYFIGFKGHAIRETNTPPRKSCFLQKGTMVVFFVSNYNESYAYELITKAESNVKVKLIIIFQVSILSGGFIRKLLIFRKVNVLISHHHLNHWKDEISYFGEPCNFISSYFKEEILDTEETLCVGNNQVTVVLMGYSSKRLANYDIILNEYSKMKIINQIILVWNNIHESFRTTSKTRLTLIQFNSNSMNNRFNVSNFIRTDAVLIIDDDVLISENLLQKMVSHWSENIERLVGVSSDKRYVNSNKEYKFEGKIPSLVLGKTMLFHRNYLEKYMADEDLVRWNRDRFCEDISMNALIFNCTKQKPIFTTINEQFSRKNLPEIDGASLSVESRLWNAKRTECVRWVLQHFKINFPS